MPRKTKETIETENKEKKSNKVKSSSTAKSKTTTKKTVKKEVTPTKKATKSTTKKATSKKASSTSSKTKKVSQSVSGTKKKTTRKKVVKAEPVEYYDLPYRYNQTVVKVLAQTPSTLFIYWDISDTDRKNYEKKYGEDFFENTKPVLIVYNDTLGYSFEVEINDFANSWYLHVSDSKCDYRIELGRRPIIKNEKLQDDYIYVSTSNEMEAPNDKILFNKNQKMVYYRNVKTGTVIEKTINNLSFMTNMGKIYDIYDLYKEIYKNENVEDIYDLNNPSS